MLKPFILSLLICCAASSMAQVFLTKPSNLEATYTKETRTLNGMPGKNYWQNTANYQIKVNFDPATRTLSGSVDIDFTNNSPDTLKELIFKLYPNFYKKGSMRNYRVDDADMGDGVKLKKLIINQADRDLSKLTIDGTN